jgi:hypothetical protein
MITPKNMLGVLSLLMTAVAYSLYIWQTARQKNIQPHPVSWFLFGLATTVVFKAQWVRSAGPGSWVTAVTALVCFIITALSLEKYRLVSKRKKLEGVEPDERIRSMSNIVSFVLSVIAIFVFLHAKSPLGAAISATAADLVGYYPTIKKGRRQPFNDSTTSFALNSAKFIPALFAMGSYSLATCFYPAALVAMNGYVVILLMEERKKAAFPEESWSPKIAWLCYKPEWGDPIPSPVSRSA